ncbi:Nefa_Nip30_N domain-containing protein [Cephalotus follicularis]|uniref:Nefa_Nip30_N domain-containing protein n=1 Tax=Cephalotus follicularis TaxID=3775 RepID=A0A1Q3C8R3_CEPFO|nr:Nefa_Nip30_N domain-containing protein [Cephalotus follicularis]
MDEESSCSTRLMNFVSEEQLYEAKQKRGERVEDGTAQRDRPLYEILKENKDKQDAEFNERFKHRPPKSLDEDETEFLDNLEMSKREYERQMAEEEVQQLRTFQAEVAAQSTIVHKLKETPSAPVVQERKSVGKKNPPSRSLCTIINVQPKAKKSKSDQVTVESDQVTVEEPSGTAKTDDFVELLVHGQEYLSFSLKSKVLEDLKLFGLENLAFCNKTCTKTLLLGWCSPFQSLC